MGVTNEIPTPAILNRHADWDERPIQDIVDCLDHLRVPLNGAQRQRMQGNYPYCGANGVLDYIDSYCVDDSVILIAEDGGYFDEYATRSIAYRMAGKFWVNNHAHVLKAKAELDQDFIFHSLVHKDILAFLASGTRAKLNKSELNKITISLPRNKEEQTRIASALNDADAYIESLDQLLAKKRAVMQGAMQELLTGKRRLPGFSGEWETKPLSDLAELKSGEAITGAGLSDGAAYPCYGGNGLRGYTNTFTHDGRSAIIGRQGALCGNVTFVSGRFFASEHAVVVRANANTDSRWLAFLLRRANLNQYSESSAQPGLSVAKISFLEFAVPPTKGEQTAIAAVLSDMDTELTELKAEIAKARNIKQGMMQELLTGKVRLV